MAVPSTPASDFCAACGFPLRGPRCEACGVDRGAAGGRRGGRAAADLDWDSSAVEALRARDPLRFVGHCVSAEAGVTLQPASSQDGVGWIVPLGAMDLFVGLDTGAGRISVDVPVVRIADRQRVPLLRTSLELCGGPSPARLCLRDDLLLLRRVGRVASFSPEGLRLALRDSAAEAEELSATLSTWFDARPPFTEEQRANLTWAAAGRARPLKSFSIPPVPVRSPLSVRAPPAGLPDEALTRPAGLRLQAPRGLQDLSAAVDAARSAEGRESIPDILSPTLATSPGPPSSAPVGRNGGGGARPGTLPPVGPDPGSHPPSSRPVQIDPRAEAPERRAPTLSIRRGSTTVAAIAPPPVSVRPPPMPELELDPLSRQGAQARADPSNTPVDRLCQLLHEAQVLAAALSFQERSGTMVLLIRSTVFRAILDFGETLPDAVAHLYRSTAAATRELAQAEGGGRRQNPLAIAEPALLVMERIVTSRGQVPEEKPLHIDSLSTAALAREHLGRYLREIERAPADPALRHFLALGALSELLARTKLPAKTEQRLRDIVQYAQRDGAKAQAIDLLMTALTRIVAQ